ncbi:DUF1266 domain-containing protein [Anaerosporobacter sp.]|uniref:DUF1266 domain-containing protein n=1 Tax=Anaerosporobacter sp. TaxID=1872529 RepID=UPI00286F77C6|nr:DUF1266 domain-containing protein [Anaerosporobacter sp.]
MSTFEKVAGFILIIIICVVAVVVMSVGVSILSKWAEKRINPFKKFPRYPKGETLSNEKQRALNVGAILAEVNSDFCNSLQTSKPGAKRTIVNILREDWGISSSEDAINILERLKCNGHHKIFNLILKKSSEVLAPTHSFETMRQVYEQVGFSLLDEEMLEESEAAITLLEKNIDLLFEASSFEEIEQNKSLFSDDETFNTCIGIYSLLIKEYRDYVEYIQNFKEALPDLRDYGFVGEISELAKLNVIAWDMGRMVNVARYCYDCGYLTENQAWEYIFHAEKESALCYEDWAEFGKAYVIGRAIWGGKNLNLNVTMRTVETMKKDKASPWGIVGLK